MAKRILVADDAPNVRYLVSTALRNRGYEVVEAVDGKEAWEKATTLEPDLIVLDAMMPHQTGFDICADLRRHPRWCRIRVIMLTAISQDVAQGDDYWKKKSRADDFMSKPFRVAELVARVDRLLGPEP